MVSREIGQSSGLSAALLGREEELADLRAMIAAGRTGPAAAVVRGEAGIGKTALWETAVAAARAAGHSVLMARAVSREAQMSFAVLSDLLDGVHEEVLAVLEGPLRGALARALLLEEGSSGPDARAVGSALVAAVRALARAGPLVVAVDDVQWVDSASRPALAFAARRLAGLPVLLLLTERAEPGEPLPLELDGVRFEGGVRTVTVGPLSLGALGAMLGERLDVRPPRTTLRRIAELSGGNPLFALEIARAHRDLGDPLGAGSELPVPRSLDALVRGRLLRLSAPTREALLVAAAAAEPTRGLVEAALDREVDLAAAAAADVVRLEGDRIRFAHPLLLTAVYRSAGPRQRREAHRRLAGVVADAEERARHGALAAVGPDAAVADELEAAAAAALARGAPDAAAELAERSHALTPPEQAERSVERLLDAAEYHVMAAADVPAAVLLERALAAAPAGDLRARGRFLLGAVWVNEGKVAIGVEQLEAALADAADAALASRIEARLAEALLLSGQVGAEAHAARAVELAERSASAAAIAAASAVFGRIVFNRGGGIPRGLMERALAVERSSRAVGVDASLVYAHQLCWSGEIVAARALLESLLGIVNERADPSALSDLYWYRGIAEFYGGDWPQAAAAAASSSELAQQIGQDFMLVGSNGLEALLAAHRGEVDAAAARTAEALASLGAGSGSNLLEVFPRAAAGVSALLGGMPLEARQGFDRCCELFGSSRLREPGMWFFIGDAVATLVELDELDRAEGLLAPYEEAACELGREWASGVAARGRGMIAAARNQLERAERQFERALAAHESCELPLELATTLLEAGRLDRRAGRRGRARERLGRAAVLFESLGALPRAERARHELARVPGRTAAAAGALTPTEQRVAALVAEGKTNAEAARELHVTVNTVEHHLSHVYAKLGVRSRTELARRLPAGAGGSG